MSSLKGCRRLALTVCCCFLLVLVASCEGAEVEEYSEAALVQAALSGANGVSRHMVYDHAYARVIGTGNTGGSCETYEVVVNLYEQEIYTPGSNTERQIVSLRVRKFCCETDNLLSTWNGSISLNPDDYVMESAKNHNELAYASVLKTVTVRNAANRTELMQVDLDLVWEGYDYYDYPRNDRRIDGVHVLHYGDHRNFATLSGNIFIDNVDFNFDSQEHVLVGHQIRTDREAPQR